MNWNYMASHTNIKKSVFKMSGDLQSIKGVVVFRPSEIATDRVQILFSRSDDYVRY